MASSTTHEPNHDSDLFGRTEIAYRIVRSTHRKKAVTLSLDKDGLTVRVPVRFPAERVREVVRKRGVWVVKRGAQLDEMHAHREPPRRLANGEALRYLGRQYRLKRVESLGEVRLWGGYLEVPQGKTARVREVLEAWYKGRAEAKLPERVALYSLKLGIKPSKLLVRSQQKRWGSCNARGEIRLNWRITMAPMSLVDYVMVHELVHLEHLNHSKAYWQRVGEILPDYRKRRERLEVQGSTFRFKSTN